MTAAMLCDPDTGPNPSGLCMCGCGDPAPVARFRTRGTPKGAAYRFIRGHHHHGNHYALKHGHTVPAGRTPEYKTWLAMVARCTNPNRDNWKYYGGRGISVCDRWRHSFENFLADMGARPEGKTLDRINNDGNYEPSNCRWATVEEQRANRRRTA